MSNKKEEIIEKTWQYLLQVGLSASSVGDLCRATGLAQSSLYHWFANKDEIWISAGRYGLSKVVEALMQFTFTHTDDISGYFATFLDEVDKYKDELRLAIQITTSPIYGERMRSKSRDFRIFYERYADKFLDTLDCTAKQANIFIYTIISVVVDYVVWDDRDIAQMLLDNLHKRTVENLGI